MQNESADDRAYAVLLERQWQEWEARCSCCGACCGIAEGDPCEHLAQSENGKYLCRIYENRFGLYKTISGKPFRCVPIRDILHKNWPGEHRCGYKKMGA
jgi:hypothetical protein